MIDIKKIENLNVLLQWQVADVIFSGPITSPIRQETQPRVIYRCEVTLTEHKQHLKYIHVMWKNLPFICVSVCVVGICVTKDMANLTDDQYENGKTSLSKILLQIL